MFTAAAASVSHSHLHWMHVCCPWKSAAWILLISYSGCAPSLQMHVFCSLYPLPDFYSSLRYPCYFPIATGVSHTCTASSLLISHFHRFNTWSSHSHSILRAFPFNIYIFKFWGQQCAGTPALLLSHIRATLPTVQTKTLSRPDKRNVLTCEGETSWPVFSLWQDSGDVPSLCHCYPHFPGTQRGSSSFKNTKPHHHIIYIYACAYFSFSIG